MAPKVRISPSQGWKVQSMPAVPKMNGQAMATSKAMNSALKGSKMIGSPMTDDQIAKRKKTMVSNAASKLMGGLYSK